MPVALGLGAAGYLALKSEPPLWLLIDLAAPLVLLAVWSARRGHNRAVVALLVLLACAATGALAGKVRAERVRTPVAPASDRVRQVEAWVVDVASPGASGARLVLAPVRISGLQPDETPKRIRVSLRQGEAPAPGSAILIKAIVGPPPPPASPGAYDFSRDAWFDGIGGVGFGLTAPETTDLPPPPRRLAWQMAVNRTRWDLAQKIYADTGPKSGGLAAAMVTGYEAWIPKAQVDDMRASGLAHIISISGLHMAIVGGAVFFLVRLLVALWPWLALRVPGKKIAAVAGLVALGVYLVISGSPPPAERSAITAAVALLAILADRRAISLHALAVAAIVILLLQPEAASEPGFQMSFSATTALVALAELWPQPVREISAPWWIRAPQAVGVWIAASLAASFVAGAATAPFAMHHFNRMASYGLFANLAVAPLSSFVIMPFLALGAALEPLGLGRPFLQLAGWGIAVMTDISHAVAGAPLAQVVVASGPNWTLVVSFLGMMLLCLWRGPVRWLGLPLALCVALWPKPTPPDLWISDDGSAIAMRDGKLAVLPRPKARRFAADLWSRRRGLASLEATDLQFSCNRSWCLPVDGSVAIWAMRKAPSEAQAEVLCGAADVVVFRSDAPWIGCPGKVVLSRADFARGGAAELWKVGSDWRVVWAQDLRGHRPWTGGVGEED
jgi:competence protein ComEC